MYFNDFLDLLLQYCKTSSQFGREVDEGRLLMWRWLVELREKTRGSRDCDTSMPGPLVLSPS